MASIAFAAAGAYLAPAGYASWGWMAGSMIGNALFPTKLPEQRIEGPRLADNMVMSSTYGRPIPIIKGRGRVAGELIWAKPIDETPVVTQERRGGKGGPRQTVTSVSYITTVDCAVAFTGNQGAGIRKLWIDKELVYNVGGDASPATLIASTEQWRSARIYLGTEDQEPDPLIVATEGATPAYKGIFYIVFEALKTRGQNIPLVEIEFIERAATGLVYTVHDYLADDGIDAVPAKLAHLRARQEVWVFIPHGANSKIVVHDLRDGSRSTFPPPGGRFAEQTDDSRLPFINEDAGLLFTSPNRESGDPGQHVSAVVMDVASRTVLADFGPSLLGRMNTQSYYGSAASSAHVLGGDDQVICYWLYVGNGFALARIDSWTGVSVVPMHEIQLADPPSGNRLPRGTAVMERDGVWWAATTRDLLRFATAGGVQAFPFFGQDPDAPRYTTAEPSVQVYAGAIYALMFDAVEDRVILAALDASALQWQEVRHFGGETGTPVSVAIDPRTGGMTVIMSQSEIVRFASPDGPEVVRYDIGESSGDDITVDPTQTPAWTRQTSIIAGELSLSLLHRGLLELRLSSMEPEDRILGEVIEEIALMVPDIAAHEIDASALTTPVHGYTLGRTMTARAAIELLMDVYVFDAVERDGVVVFVPRGGAPVAEIPFSDLAAHLQGSQPPPVVDAREALETELPREVTLLHFDASADYQQGAQPARRQTTNSHKRVQIEAPLVLFPDEAQGMAERYLFARWAEAGARDFAVPIEYEELEPTDVVILHDRNVSHAVRILGRDSSRGLIRCRALTEVQAAHTQPGVGGGYASTTTQITLPGIAALYPLDIPLLRDQDDGVGFYAVAALAGGAQGAELWRSIDDGVSYAPTLVSFLVGATVGRCLTGLPDFHGGNVLDGLSSVDIVLTDGELSSISDQAMFGGENAAVIGSAAKGFELIQYASAVLIAPKTYRLSRLRRGRRGSEWAMGQHAAGDLFVLLDAATARRIEHSADEIGIERSYKLPAFGQLVSQAPRVRFRSASVGLKPHAPVHLRAGKTTTASYDIVAGWTPRRRINVGWRSGVVPALGESIESYRVRIYEDETFAAVAREWIVDDARQVTYTHAQQISDFGANVTECALEVIPRSAVVGDGYPARAVLSVVTAGGVEAPPPVFNAWSPDDKTTHVVLSNDDRTATADTNNFETIRAMKNDFSSTGGRKRYWEMVVETLAAPNDCYVGLYRTATAIASGTLFTGSGQYASWRSNGVYQNAGWSAGSGPVSYTVGDVLMFALDEVTGRLWVGKNETWNDSGDPAAGTNPSFTSMPSDPEAPFMATDNVAGAVSVTLRSDPSEMSYSPPAGFTAGLF